jgi:hypothetical protein
MKTAAAIRYFGSKYAVAMALGIKPPSVHRWGIEVPGLRQIQLEIMTRGALKASPALKVKPLPLARRRRKKKAKPVPAPETAPVEASDA